MGRATSNFFLAPPPGAFGRGQNVKYHLISITKSISKIFLPNFVCVLTYERYFGALGVPRGSKKKNFKHGHVVYQIDRDDEQNRMQVNFSS